jgi:hypothetical protein
MLTWRFTGPHAVRRFAPSTRAISGAYRSNGRCPVEVFPLIQLIQQLPLRILPRSLVRAGRPTSGKWPPRPCDRGQGHAPRSPTNHTPEAEVAAQTGCLDSLGPCDGALIHRFQEVLDSMLADLAAVFNPLLDCLAKMIPDQDARDPVFLGGLREAGV